MYLLSSAQQGSDPVFTFTTLLGTQPMTYKISAMFIKKLGLGRGYGSHRNQSSRSLWFQCIGNTTCKCLHCKNGILNFGFNLFVGNFKFKISQFKFKISQFKFKMSQFKFKISQFKFILFLNN